MLTGNRFTIKGLKSHDGHDGLCFVASLYLDGKKLGTVRNDGNGGPNFYETEGGHAQLQTEIYPIVEAILDANPDGCWAEFRKDKPLNDSGQHYFSPLDFLVEAMIEELEIAKQIKRHCRTKICFRSSSTEPDSFGYFKCPFTAQNREWVIKKLAERGDTDIEILNETVAGKTATPPALTAAQRKGLDAIDRQMKK